MSPAHKSVPKAPVEKTQVSKMQVSQALAMGLMRAKQRVGKGALADAMSTSTKTIDRALTEETLPELHTAFSALNADETALDEVAALYGVVIRPRDAMAANDMAVAARLAHGAGALAEALADGRRDHRETLALADLFRPLMHQIGAIVEEADALRAGKRA